MNYETQIVGFHLLGYLLFLVIWIAILGDSPYMGTQTEADWFVLLSICNFIYGTVAVFMNLGGIKNVVLLFAIDVWIIYFIIIGCSIYWDILFKETKEA